MASCNDALRVDKVSSNIKTTVKNLNVINKKAYKVSFDLKEVSFILTPEICRAILADCPQNPNVSYVPKIDVNGNAVAGVDLNPSPIKLPENIRIPIGYSKISRFTGRRIRATTAADGSFSSQFVDEIPLGFMDYELKSGNIAFNGQKLMKNESRILRQKCRKILILEK